MKQCDTCTYGNKSEYEKPCIVYKGENCELYEKRGDGMTREEKESLLREAVDILIKLDNHLMTSRDNAEFSQWVEDLIDNYCEERGQGECPYYAD